MRGLAFVLVSLVVPALGCSSTSTPVDASVVVTVDGAKTNACLAFGQGNTCQSAATCSPGTVNVQDLSCGSGQLCCSRVPEGGVDATNDVQIFIDGAVFETGTPDAAHDATIHDASTDVKSTDAGTDAGHDAASHEDATHHDASSVPDSGADALHATDGGVGDAKHG
jgi:hypothetical protein